MSYAVNINRQDISALFDMKGDPNAIEGWVGASIPPFPQANNRQTLTDGKALFHIGRNHWILRTGIEREEEYLEVLRPSDAPPEISIVRISDTLTFFDITGPDAANVMSIACPLDLHPTIFADDEVTYTEVFGLKALVRRVADGFEFGIEQSFGDMIADYLARTLN